MPKKTAVILFNLGGPDGPAAVEPFLFNLFHDPAIIRLPQPWRFLTAKLIAARRASVARKIYSRLGGGSPIVRNTEKQARALEDYLNENETPLVAAATAPMGADTFEAAQPKVFKCFVAMRYWHPFSHEALWAVEKFDPDHIILLPLYPQFSTTTTASSFRDFHDALSHTQWKKKSLIHRVCCYPNETGFIRALASLTRAAYEKARTYGQPRVLFSAHGLPEKIINAGDPYQWQCEQTAAALKRELDIVDLDTVLCYQSRVGSMKWIGPSTDEEIQRAGKDCVPIVVAPIAFVSEHSETLVEIDIEYRELARKCGVPFFASVPAAGTSQEFIEGLAGLVRHALSQPKTCVSVSGGRLCPKAFLGCPHAAIPENFARSSLEQAPLLRGQVHPE